MVIAINSNITPWRLTIYCSPKISAESASGGDARPWHGGDHLGVYSWSAPGVSFTGVFVWSCTNSLHLCCAYTFLNTPSSLFPFVCIVRSVQLSVSASLVCPFLQQSLSTSDPVTVALREAAKQGNQSIVQFLVKQFVNVEDEVGRVSV